MNTTKFPDEYWTETESRIEFILGPAPSELPITAVKVYALQGEALLLTRVARGWDLPGGHVEPGESPKEAMVREIQEETGGRVEELSLLGYVKVTNEKQNALNSRYPKESCMLMYVGRGVIFDEEYDLAQFEATACELVPFADVSKFHHNWTPMKQHILDYAASGNNEDGKASREET